MAVHHSIKFMLQITLLSTRCSTVIMVALVILSVVAITLSEVMVQPMLIYLTTPATEHILTKDGQLAIFLKS